MLYSFIGIKCHTWTIYFFNISGRFIIFKSDARSPYLKLLLYKIGCSINIFICYLLLVVFSKKIYTIDVSVGLPLHNVRFQCFRIFVRYQTITKHICQCIKYFVEIELSTSWVQYIHVNFVTITKLNWLK